jgi:hypothetical protein
MSRQGHDDPLKTLGGLADFFVGNTPNEQGASTKICFQVYKNQ